MKKIIHQKENYIHNKDSNNINIRIRKNVRKVKSQKA